MFTAVEVLSDIQRFEGIDVELPVFVMNSKFMKLYSECFDKPVGLSKSNTVFTDRLYQYLADKSSHLLNPDIDPDQVTTRFICYGYMEMAEGVTLIGCCDRSEDFDTMIPEADSCPYKELMVVDKRSRTISLLSKNQMKQ